MTSPREALKAAIEAHDAAVAATKNAEATLARARSFAGELEADLAEFADVDARVAASRAASIKSAMASGAQPVFEMSGELHDAVARKHDTENRMAAAKQAVEALTAERDAAKKAAERASLDLEWAAEKVMASEADALATEYAAKLTETRSLYLQLWSISQTPIRRPPEDLTRFNSAPTRPIALPLAAANAVHAAEVTIESNATRRDLYRKQVRASVAGWLSALKQDAAARLEVPKEGLRVVSEEEAA